SGANIIVSPQVTGSITLSINNVPWNTVLESVVKTLGFVTVKEDFGIIRIIHRDELLKQMEDRVFPLKWIQPSPTYSAKVTQGRCVHGSRLHPAPDIEEILRRFALKRVIETVLSKTAAGVSVGKLEFDPQQNVFIVRDTKNVLDRISNIIQILDVEPK